LSSMGRCSCRSALSSIAIGILLCGVALGVAWLTHGLLIGEGATSEDQAHATKIARETDGVVDVVQLLTLHLGPDEVILAFKIAFRPTLSVRDVENTTNEIERRIREAMPRMRKIFIEADSKGDGIESGKPSAIS
jgi:divalent metal cation (Fe/Co/Zn/Cd) transporter